MKMRYTASEQHRAADHVVISIGAVNRNVATRRSCPAEEMTTMLALFTIELASLSTDVCLGAKRFLWAVRINNA